MITVLGSIVNIIGGTVYDLSMSMRIVTLIMHGIFIQTLEMMRTVAMALFWNC